MQAVAKAKDKIKKFRRRASSSHETYHQERRGSVEDLPPPYSENPPFNPFYNDLVHNVSQPGGGDAGDTSRSSDDLCSGRRSVGGGSRHVSDRVSPMYPVLPNIPPYSSPPGGNPPPFSAVNRRGQFGRRDSFLLDSEQDPSSMMGDMNLTSSIKHV